jgi:transcription initiation factor TFIID subunit TAF12
MLVPAGQQQQQQQQKQQQQQQQQQKLVMVTAATAKTPPATGGCIHADIYRTRLVHTIRCHQHYTFNLHDM